MAEIEHQKLNLKEPHHSAPPFDSALANEKENIKTSFENLKLNIESTKLPSNTVPVENNSKVKLPLLIKQNNMKFFNLRKPVANPAVPYYIINSLPGEKTDVKCTSACK